MPLTNWLPKWIQLREELVSRVSLFDTSLRTSILLAIQAQGRHSSSKQQIRDKHDSGTDSNSFCNHEQTYQYFSMKPKSDSQVLLRSPTTNQFILKLDFQLRLESSGTNGDRAKSGETQMACSMSPNCDDLWHLWASDPPPPQNSKLIMCITNTSTFSTVNENKPRNVLKFLKFIAFCPEGRKDISFAATLTLGIWYVVQKINSHKSISLLDQ